MPRLLLPNCLFCCFIALLSPENWSSESWERQHLVGTGKKAYLQSPPTLPPPSPIPLLDRDRCKGGVGFSPEPQLTPGEEALTSGAG